MKVKVERKEKKPTFMRNYAIWDVKFWVEFTDAELKTLSKLQPERIAIAYPPSFYEPGKKDSTPVTASDIAYGSKVATLCSSVAAADKFTEEMKEGLKGLKLLIEHGERGDEEEAYEL